MPDVSKAQFRLMHMIKANPKKAKEFHIPAKVAKDFVAADKKAHVNYSKLPEHK